ncbi:peptidoglycan-binding domain-containing protein [Amycolatopsis sp. lyj-23]|uniref:peptidoglycan-binding domain-containing protein n=1 Tax=Amycolatopsis sp. lyj-23 TaxID=2789283 RepID=UPI00397A402A
MDKSMLDRVMTALSSVEENTCRKWLALVRADLADVLDWTEFKSDTVPTAGSDAGLSDAAGAAFVQALENSSSDPLAELESMFSQWSDDQLVAARRPAGGAARFAGEVLSRIPEWFTGSPEHWATLRPWLLDAAGRAGLAVEASRFAGEVDAAADKRAVFAGYGVVLAGGAPADPGAGRTEDVPGFTRAVLSQVPGGFTGSAEHWERLRPWLLDTAARAGFTAEAARFAGEVDAAADKPAVFTEYGVTLAGAPAPALAGTAAPAGAPAEQSTEPESLADLLADVENDPDLAPETPAETEQRLAAAEAADVDAAGRPVLDDTDLDGDLSEKVRLAQEQLGLVPDGVVGEKTWAAFIAKVGTDFADEIGEDEEADAEASEEVSV